MLHTATVYPRTLEILVEIMKNPTFQPFNLVGGTALALQIGHRISIDLDVDPIMLKKVTWNTVKKRIEQQTQEYLNTL